MVLGSLIAQNHMLLDSVLGLRRISYAHTADNHKTRTPSSGKRKY